MGPCLRGLPRLRRLDVQSNRLTAVDGLGACASLEELYLARNAIADLWEAAPEEEEEEEERGEGQGGGVVATGSKGPAAPGGGGGEASAAGARVPALGGCAALHTVDLSNNRLASFAGLEGCGALEEVWASANLVADLGAGPGGALEALAKLPALGCVYLEHNPAALALRRDMTTPGITPLELDADYRAALLRSLPCLTQIDATPVRSARGY